MNSTRDALFIQTVDEESGSNSKSTSTETDSFNEALVAKKSGFTWADSNRDTAESAPKLADVIENKSDEESDEETDEESILAQSSRLLKYLRRAKKDGLNVMGVAELINNFTTASAYPLSDDEEECLIHDMKAAADLLEAGEEYVNSKDGDKYSSDARVKFEGALDHALTCAATEVSSTKENVRSIFIKIGMALSIVAVGAAVGVLAAGLSPFIVAGCLVAGVALLAAAAISQYRQTNYTFFGQTQQNHMLMADLIIDQSDSLETKAPGCFG